MSESKLRKSRLKRFIEKGHTHCCYCGGIGFTESIDHIPPTIFFNQKLRPDTYLVPACNHCHRPFSKFDTFFALLVRTMSSASTNSKPDKYFHNLVSNSVKYFPDAVIQFTGHADRVWVRNQNVVHPAVKISFDHDDIHGCIEFMSARICLALFYHHTKHIAPIGTIIQTMWRSNHQILSGVEDLKLLKMFPNYEFPKMGKKEYADQLEYRYYFEPDVCFYIGFVFHKSFTSYAFIDFTDPCKLSIENSFLVSSVGPLPLDQTRRKNWASRGLISS